MTNTILLNVDAIHKKNYCLYYSQMCLLMFQESVDALNN